MNTNTALVKKNVLILGSSHIGSFLKAHKEFDHSPLKNQYQFKFLMDFRKDSRIIEPIDGNFQDFGLNKELESYLRTITNIDAIVISISGSDYLPICISNSTPPYDVILPQQPDLPFDNKAIIIPIAEIRARLIKDIRHILLGIEEIKRVTNLPLYYLQSPPPVGCNDHIKDHAAWAKNIIDKNGVSPSILRYKIWKIHSDLIAEKCSEMSVSYILNPAEVLEEKMFLHKSAYSDDLMHANTWYGQKFLSHIDGRI